MSNSAKKHKAIQDNMACSNVASDSARRLNNHSYQYLNSGIDTFELGFTIYTNTEQATDSICQKWWHYLNELKIQARQLNNGFVPINELQFPIDEPVVFSMSSWGAKPYTYLVRSAWCDIAFSNKSEDSNKPPIHVRFHALACASFTPTQLVTMVCKMFRAIGIPVKADKISRLDYFVDFTGYQFSTLDNNLFVSRARFRPVYPNINDPETFQFGKGSLVLRVYNKSVELLTQPAKSWVRSTWLHVPTEPVWRVEYQMRREFLKSYYIDTFEDFKACFTELVGYLFSWTYHSGATERIGHDNERPPSELWEWLMSYLNADPPRRRKPSRSSQPQLAQIARTMNGYFVSAGAVMGEFDFWETFNGLLDYFEELHTLATFEERVKRRMVEKSCVPDRTGSAAHMLNE